MEPINVKLVLDNLNQQYANTDHYGDMRGGRLAMSRLKSKSSQLPLIFASARNNTEHGARNSVMVSHS